MGGALAAFSLIASGCASVEMSSPESLAGINIYGTSTKADRMVVIRNSGFYFLGMTIVSGDLSWNEETEDINGGWSITRDQARIADCYRALQFVADREERDLADVTFHENSVMGFAASTSDTMTMALGAMGAIFGLYEVEASAVLREKSPESKAREVMK